MELRDLLVDIESEQDVSKMIEYLSGVLAELKATPLVVQEWTLASSLHGYRAGTNPAGPEAEFRCSDCSLELFGEDVGYVAAGNNYANGEFAPCPRCGKEYQVYRDDENDE